MADPELNEHNVIDKLVLNRAEVLTSEREQEAHDLVHELVYRMLKTQDQQWSGAAEPLPTTRLSSY